MIQRGLHREILFRLQRNLCDGKRRKMFRGIYLHLDMASVYNAKRSRQEITRTKANRVVHPSYSPDGAPSDLFLFGHLKSEMARFTAGSAEDILSVIPRIFERIPKEIPTAVYNEWIIRLQWITEHNGEHYHMDEKKSISS
jgi:hypothetical protein